MRALSSRRRRRLATPHARAGFSLVEILVAVTLLGVVMMSLGKLSVAIAQRSRMNELVAERSFALQQQANKFQAIPFDSIATFPLTTKSFASGDFRYSRVLRRTQLATDRYQFMIVVVPTADPTRRDSLILTRTRPPSSSVLCVGCP